MKARAIPFTEFATRVLRIPLTPGQHVLCRVAFDNVEPKQLTGNERELAREIFGDIETVPKDARRNVVALLGRNSGKTTLAAGYALHTMLTGDVSRCGVGDVPVVVVVAPDKRTAGLSVRMALEMAKSTGDIARLLESEASDGFTIRRHDGRLVSFEAFAASRGGASARGRSILTFLLDEAWFFRSDDGGAYVVNDRDIYRALIPRLLADGKGVFLSTPWPVETLMGEFFAQNHGAPSKALAARAPTTLMRQGDAHIADIVRAERERDPENAAREFDCDTSLTGGGGFFDGTAIEAAIDERPRPLAPTNFRTAAGCDFGFKSDSSAIVVVRFTGEVYEVAELLEMRPQRGRPLVPSEVVAKFAMVAKSHGVAHVIADAHYRESVHEHLRANGLGIVDAPTGLNGKLASYGRARAVLHDGRLRLPKDTRLLSQLREITSKPTPGGGTTIISPRRAGSGHGDLVSALVLAVHGLTHAQGPPPPSQEPPKGTPEWRSWHIANVEEPKMLEAQERRYGVRERWWW